MTVNFLAMAKGHYLFRSLGLILICWSVSELVRADEQERLDAPLFSVSRGHFDNEFELELRAPADNLAIRYTVDGSDPSQEGVDALFVLPGPDGQVASTSLLIDRTMSVRAFMTATGSQSSKVTTHSYLFPKQVLRQGTPGQEIEEWGHSGPDWEMDQDIVNHRDVESRVVVDDMTSIPALFVSLPFAALWGDQGIYIAGEGEEVHCSIELLNESADPDAPNKVAGLQVDATIEVTGGSSTERWKTDKLSLRIRFKHGAEFPFLTDSGIGADANPVESFHTLILDARLNETWNHPSSRQRRSAQYTRDQFMADLQLAGGGNAPRGRHVHLYLAGVYWGVYMLHERPDHHFAAAHRGGDSGDWEVVKHNAADVVHGDGQHFQRLWDRLMQSDIATEQAYQEVSTLLDVEDFAHYMLINYWAGNTDWSHQNWYATYLPGDSSGRWRFHSWDAELTLRDLDSDVTAKNDIASPTGIQRRLMMNQAYRTMFDNEVREAMQPGGLLDPARLTALYMEHLAEVDAAVRAESARWGDNQRRRPYTRGDDWMDERDRLLESFIPRRTDIALEQFRGADW